MFRVTDGMPRADAKPEHPGIIVNIEPRNKPPMSFPCDTFTHWHDNLRAIALTLEALRKVDRYGVTQTGQQYRGWQAIEAAPPSSDAINGACTLLASVAWPNENATNQAEWAPKILTDSDIARRTYRKGPRQRIPRHPWRRPNPLGHCRTGSEATPRGRSATVTEPLRHVLIRALDFQLNEQAGLMVAEILYRDVTFRTNRGGIDPGEYTMPGIVLIGSGDDLEPVARGVARHVLKIMRTTELLWLPLNGRRDFGSWTVEAVPLVDYTRLISRSDEAIMRDSNIDPTTGQYIGQEPPR